MKKFALMAIAGLALMACKKNYTCSCGNSTSSKTPVFEVKDTKKKAKKKCDDYLSTVNTYPEYTCEIK